MFISYTRKASIDTYAGIQWMTAGGYEEVRDSNGVPTFYVVDSDARRIVKFDSNWNYQAYYNLPAYNAIFTKYVNGYFYFSGTLYFFKTDTNFVSIKSYYNQSVAFRQFAYDSSSALFYVTAFDSKSIDIINAVPSYVNSISVTYNPYSVYIYSGSVYVGLYNINKIARFPLSDPANINFYDFECTQTVSIYIDSLTGYMITSCYNNNRVEIYGTGKYLTTSSYPFTVAIDSYGRLIINTKSSIDIYY
jgi:hypothetical protein